MDDIISEWHAGDAQVCWCCHWMVGNPPFTDFASVGAYFRLLFPALLFVLVYKSSGGAENSIFINLVCIAHSSVV